MLPEVRGRGLQEVASYFLTVAPPPRIGLLRLGPPSLDRLLLEITASLERAGKRVLLLRSDHQPEERDLIAIRTGGVREGPLADFRTKDERLEREERASDLLLFLLHSESPALPRLLPLLSLLVLLLPGEPKEVLAAYRSAKRILMSHRALLCGVFAAGEGETAPTVLKRFLLGLHVFLDFHPLDFGTTAPTCVHEILATQLESPAEPYFHGNS